MTAEMLRVDVSFQVQMTVWPLGFYSSQQRLPLSEVCIRLRRQLAPHFCFLMRPSRTQLYSSQPDPYILENASCFFALWTMYTLKTVNFSTSSSHIYFTIYITQFVFLLFRVLSELECFKCVSFETTDCQQSLRSFVLCTLEILKQFLYLRPVFVTPNKLDYDLYVYCMLSLCKGLLRRFVTFQNTFYTFFLSLRLVFKDIVVKLTKYF